MARSITTRKRTRLTVKDMETCPYCEGFGYTSEHDTHPHPDGDCLGMCPVPVQCEKCRATGKVNKTVAQEYKKQAKTENGEIDLLF